MKHTTLVTGGCGFIGSFITERLLSEEMDIVITSRKQSNCWRVSEAKNIKIVEGDLTDPSFVQDLFSRFSPDNIIHAAWEGIHGKQRHSNHYERNLVSMHNLLSACAQGKTTTFIGIGSQAEYGVHNKRICEDTWPKPTDNYGIYKLAAGLLGQKFAETHGLRYAWLRLFSSYGPKDNDHYILPFVMESLMKGVAPDLTGCEQRWDYLFVKDIPNLITKVLKKEGPFCGIYNLCSGNPVVLKNLIMFINDHLKTDIEPAWGAKEYQENGLFHLEGDNTKFKNEFGWIPLTPYSEGLVETIEWFRENYHANTQ